MTTVKAPASKESVFDRTADWVSAAMGRPANIIVGLVLVGGWTALFATHIVVEPDRSRLADLAGRVGSGRLNPVVGAVRSLAGPPDAFAPDHRVPGKTIIQVSQGR